MSYGQGYYVIPQIQVPGMPYQQTYSGQQQIQQLQLQPQPQQQQQMMMIPPQQSNSYGMQYQTPPMPFGSGMQFQQGPAVPHLQLQPQPQPLPPQTHTSESPVLGGQTWLDEKYAMKGAGFYISLEDAEKETGFFTQKMANGYANYLRDSTKDLLNNINTRDFMEKHSMTMTEAEAVAIYTYDFGPENMEKNPYYAVNLCLRDRVEGKINMYLGYVIHLLRGLRKLEKPNVSKLYRAIKGSASNYALGSPVMWDSFTSTTSNGDVVYKFINGTDEHVIFEIVGEFHNISHSVRDLSFHPEEDEIIIEPGMTSTVIGVVTDPKKPNTKRVTIEVKPTAPVLAKAVQFFSGEEKKLTYHILPEDVMHFRPADYRRTTAPWDVSALLSSNSFAEVLALAKNCGWYPEFFLGLLSQFGSSGSGTGKSKLYMLAASFTQMFMPTLSEIKDGKAAGVTYGVYQCSQNCQYNGAVVLEGVPCGISTKIPELKGVTFPRRFGVTLVSVGARDTIEVIRDINKIHTAQPNQDGRYSKIACLNMGSQDSPGGGWKMGGGSLEELLFICTTLSSSLEDYLYPMKNFECIYTKDVTYIRAGANEGFRFLAPSEHFKFDVVTTCAFNLRKAVYEGNVKIKDEAIPFSEDIRNKTLNKIRAIFSACANNGADVLVLGALGCGQYNNPPFEIANLFKQVIMEYAGYFNYVYFSIFDTTTATIFNSVMSQGCAPQSNGYFAYYIR